MKRFLKILGLLIVVCGIVYAFGSRPDMTQNITFDAASIDFDADAYLSKSEAKVADIRENAEKEIVWNNPVTKEQTDIAIVYIHGFSASKVEVAPVAQNVAKALGANLFLTRLEGHGTTGADLGNATMSGWMNDTAEAIAIGKRIGKKVILLSASTGGSLSTWAAAQDQLKDQIDGLAMISPNYAVHGAPTWLMNIRWAETILPALLGAERSFEPSNEGQAKGWTTSYPSKAVFPMATLLRTLEGLDYASIQKPALFIYSTKDMVVVPQKIEEVISKWGGKTETMIVDDSTDSHNHVIAGDILSPTTTEKVSNAIIEWATKL
jgi:esterase/lipase